MDQELISLILITVFIIGWSLLRLSYRVPVAIGLIILVSCVISEVITGEVALARQLGLGRRARIGPMAPKIPG